MFKWLKRVWLEFWFGTPEFQQRMIDAEKSISPTFHVPFKPRDNVPTSEDIDTVAYAHEWLKKEDSK